MKYDGVRGRLQAIIDKTRQFDSAESSRLERPAYSRYNLADGLMRVSVRSRLRSLSRICIPGFSRDFELCDIGRPFHHLQLQMT